MKNVFSIILLTLGLLACSDDEDPSGPTTPPPPKYGKATLHLNGKPYRFAAEASPEECSSNNLSVSLAYIDENYVFVGVQLENLPTKEGKYTLQRSEDLDECTLTSSSVVTYDRPNSLAELFEVLEDEGPNELTITRYDSAAQRLEGSFQMALVKEKYSRINSSSTGYPDTLRFTKGTFVVNISPPEE